MKTLFNYIIKEPNPELSTLSIATVMNCSAVAYDKDGYLYIDSGNGLEAVEKYNSEDHASVAWCYIQDHIDQIVAKGADNVEKFVVIPNAKAMEDEMKYWKKMGVNMVKKVHDNSSVYNYANKVGNDEDETEDEEKTETVERIIKVGTNDELIKELLKSIFNVESDDEDEDEE